MKGLLESLRAYIKAKETRRTIEMLVELSDRNPELAELFVQFARENAVDAKVKVRRMGKVKDQ